MKNSLLTSLVISTSIAFVSCDSKKNDAYLSGEIKDGSGKKIYLDQLTSQSAVTVDSATIDEKGQFAFTHFKPNLNFYRVRMDQQNFAILVLDSTDKVTFVADAKI